MGIPGHGDDDRVAAVDVAPAGTFSDDGEVELVAQHEEAGLHGIAREGTGAEEVLLDPVRDAAAEIVIVAAEGVPQFCGRARSAGCAGDFRGWCADEGVIEIADALNRHELAEGIAHADFRVPRLPEEACGGERSTRAAAGFPVLVEEAGCVREVHIGNAAENRAHPVVLGAPHLDEQIVDEFVDGHDLLDGSVSGWIGRPGGGTDEGESIVHGGAGAFHDIEERV